MSYTVLKFRNSPNSLFRAQKILVTSNVMINSGQNDSIIMIVSFSQCLESMERREPETELADCNFHEDKQLFFNREVYPAF